MTDSPFALLIHPPVYDFAFYDLFARPYGLLKVGRWLEEVGWTVTCVNALDYRDSASTAHRGGPVRKPDGTGKIWRTPLSPTPASRRIERRYCRYGVLPGALEENLKNAAARTPDLICIGTGMTYWYEGVSETVRLCRKLFPSTPIAAGGVYASLLPEHCTAVAGVDFAVRGEVWPEFSRILESLSFPAPQGPPREAVLPVREIWADAGVLRLNRGCPFACDYCASRLLCPEFSPGDPDEVFLHVSELHNLCGTVNFAFYDDALLSRKDSVLIPFLRRVIGEKLPLRFHLPNAVHVRYLDRETAELMHLSGFAEVRMGFESSSADFHELHGVKFSSDEFTGAIKNLKAAGFPSSALSVYILAGLPGQRAGEVEDSVRYASGFGVRIHIAEYSPVPGTAFWEESVRRCPYPITEEPLYHNNTFFPMEWSGFTRADLERIKRLAKSTASGG